MRPLVVLTLSILSLAIHQHDAIASDLHVIIVADTLDETIGESVKIDVNRVEAEMDNVAKFSALTLRKQVISGSQLTVPVIQSTVKSLTPKQDDVVFFYYSGHGFRTPSKKNPWPSLALRNQTGLDQYQIFYTLHTKQPRLLLVVCDCCNNLLPDGAINVARAKPDLNSPQTVAAYRKLFSRSSGSIIASSSKPDQFSLCNSRDGGLFTYAFVNSLRTWVGNDEATWQAVFRTSCRTIPIGPDEQQAPQHQIYPVFSPKDGNPAVTTTSNPTAQLPTAANSPSQASPPASSVAGGRAKPLTISMNGSNSDLRILERSSGADSGRMSLNGSNEDLEIYAQKGQSLVIQLNGSNNSVQIPKSLRRNAKISITGSNNDVTYTEGDAVATTRPEPESKIQNGKPIRTGAGNSITVTNEISGIGNKISSGTTPAKPGRPNRGAGGELTLDIAGVGNEIELKVSTRNPHTGKHVVEGVGQELNYRIAPNMTVILNIAGTGNSVTIPKSLKDRVFITDTGTGSDIDWESDD